MLFHSIPYANFYIIIFFGSGSGSVVLFFPLATKNE